MKLSLSSATVVIATLFVVDFTSATNGTIEKLQETSSLSEPKPNYLNNETEHGWQEMGEC
jgi:hypothetical protein